MPLQVPIAEWIDAVVLAVGGVVTAAPSVADSPEGGMVRVVE